MNRKPQRITNWITKIKNHPSFMVMVFIGTAVIALATFTDSVNKLVNLAKTVTPVEARTELSRMAVPFENTAFVEAAAKGDVQLVELFLAAGINPNVTADKGDYQQMTALMASAWHNHLPVVEALLTAKADVNVIDRSSRNEDTALSYAVDDEKIVNLLLSHGANDQSIESAFLAAACRGNIARLQHLWPLLKTASDQASKALLKATACHGSTASEETDRETRKTVDFLLQKGADPNIQQESGWGPLHYASQSGMPRVVESLLSAGADVNRRCSCDGFGDGGWSPLALSLWYFTSEKTQIKEVFDLLIEHGADVNAISDYGRPVLMSAIETGDLDIVLRLIEKGADVNAKLTKAVNIEIVEGYTPLMFALHKSWRAETHSIVKSLLEHGADVNLADKDGWTALMLATNNHADPQIIKLLLEHGADIHAKNSSGQTAKDILNAKPQSDQKTQTLALFKANRTPAAVKNKQRPP